MTSQHEYISSLAEQGELPTGSAIIRDLIDNIDGLPGTRLQLPHGEVWLSTHAQIVEWLNDFEAAYARHESSDSRTP
jgi:hypothetical protein